MELYTLLKMKRFPFLSVIFAAALIAAVFIIIERVEKKPEPRHEGIIQHTPESVKEGKGKITKQRPVQETPQKQCNHVAIIIDDIGFDLHALRLLAELPAPLAFSVLPYTPHSAEAIEYLHERKRELLLHLPMEPLSYPKEAPGPGALMVNMDEQQIRRQLDDDLAVVPYVSGVNNHMGSRFMEDFNRLSLLMEELKKRNLYFVDSRTTPNSKGLEAAVRTGIHFASRDIFIDHEHGYEAAFQNLLKVSRQDKGYSRPLLLIGHPHPDTIRAIKTIIPLWEREGIRIVDVKTVLRRVNKSEY